MRAMSDAAPATPASSVRLLMLLIVGTAVSVGFGVYGREHDATGAETGQLFFSDMVNMKIWFTTAAVVLAAVQVVTALRIYGKISIPRQRPKWLGDVHRLSGILAFLFSLPVAFHCLWSLGAVTDRGELRPFLHSIAGCVFYGAFVVKVLAVRVKRLPDWTLPAVGGATFAALVALWATSSLWFFTTVEFPAF